MKKRINLANIAKQELKYVSMRLVLSLCYWTLMAVLMCSTAIFVLFGCVSITRIIGASRLWQSPEEVGALLYFALAHPFATSIGSCLVGVFSWMAMSSITYNDYHFETKMPSFEPLRCKYCRKDLDTSLNLICNNCYRPAPLGIKIFLFRLLSRLITFINSILVLIIILFFIAVFTIL